MGSEIDIICRQFLRICDQMRTYHQKVERRLVGDDKALMDFLSYKCCVKEAFLLFADALKTIKPTDSIEGSPATDYLTFGRGVELTIFPGMPSSHILEIVRRDPDLTKIESSASADSSTGFDMRHTQKIVSSTDK